MEAKIKIKGIDCASDTPNIEKSLLKVKGVKSVVVNYVAEIAFVNCDATVNKTDLEKGVIDAGFEVVSVNFD